MNLDSPIERGQNPVVAARREQWTVLKTPESVAPPATAPGESVLGAATETTSGVTPAAALRRQALLLTSGVAVALLFCAYLAAGIDAAQSDLHHRRRAFEQAVVDARVIRESQLRATGRTESSDPARDRLALVAEAMQSAGIPSSALLASAPQAPQRWPGSNTLVQSHRLIFAPLPLDAIMRYSFALTAAQPGLRVSGVQLRAEPGAAIWHSEVTLSDIGVAPQRP